MPPAAVHTPEFFATSWVPLCMYTLLFLGAAFRLWVHRPRTSAILTNAKFMFHVFLTLFSLGRTVSTALGLLPPDLEDPAALVVVSQLSNCSYVSLLLYLEMHWKDILKPLNRIRGRSVVYSWVVFTLYNATLYVAVGVLSWLEWQGVGGDVNRMWWANVAVDAFLVLIAVSYLNTAIKMYARVGASLGGGGKAPTKGPASPYLESARVPLVAPFEVEDVEGGDKRGGSGGGTIMAERSPLLHRHGVGGFKAIMTPGAVEEMAQLQQQQQQQQQSLPPSSPTALQGRGSFRGVGGRHAASSGDGDSSTTAGSRSRQQLRDALTVFIAIMCSSSALLFIRALLTIVFRNSAVSSWWWQLFVVWLPDVPPCIAYMLLMWPRDDDKAMAARSHSRMGQLFTRLLETEGRGVHYLLLDKATAATAGVPGSGVAVGAAIQASSFAFVAGVGGAGGANKLLVKFSREEEGAAGGYQAPLLSLPPAEEGGGDVTKVNPAPFPAPAGGSTTPSETPIDSALDVLATGLSSLAVSTITTPLNGPTSSGVVEVSSLPQASFSPPATASIVTLSAPSIFLPGRCGLLRMQTFRLERDFGLSVAQAAAFVTTTGKQQQQQQQQRQGGRLVKERSARTTPKPTLTSSPIPIPIPIPSTAAAAAAAAATGAGALTTTAFPLSPSSPPHSLSWDTSTGGGESLSMPTPIQQRGGRQKRHTVHAKGRLRLAAEEVMSNLGGKGGLGGSSSVESDGGGVGWESVMLALPSTSMKTRVKFAGGEGVGGGVGGSLNSAPAISMQLLSPEGFKSATPPQAFPLGSPSGLKLALETGAARPASSFTPMHPSPLLKSSTPLPGSLLPSSSELGMLADSSLGVEDAAVIPSSLPNTTAHVTLVAAPPAPLPLPSHATRLLSQYRKWMDAEVYCVLSVGLRCEWVPEHGTGVGAGEGGAEEGAAPTPPPQCASFWRYVGHTEPSYLEEREDGSLYLPSTTTTASTSTSSPPTSPIEGGAVTVRGEYATSPSLSESSAVYVVEGQPLLSAGAGFLVSVVLPHDLLRQAGRAAEMLQQAANEPLVTSEAKHNAALNASTGSMPSATPPQAPPHPPPVGGSWRVHAEVRGQLRWYDEGDEDKQVNLGGPGAGGGGEGLERSIHKSLHHHHHHHHHQQHQHQHHRPGQVAEDSRSKAMGSPYSHSSGEGLGGEGLTPEALAEAAPSLATVATHLARKMGWLLEAPSNSSPSYFHPSSSSSSSSSSNSKHHKGVVPRSFSFSAREEGGEEVGQEGDSGDEGRYENGEGGQISRRSSLASMRRRREEAELEEREEEEEYTLATWSTPAASLLPPTFTSLTHTLPTATYRFEECSLDGAPLPALTAVLVSAEAYSLSTLTRFPILPLPLSHLEVTVERVVAIAPGAALLAQPGTTTLNHATAWAKQGQGDEEEEEEEDEGEEGEEGENEGHLHPQQQAMAVTAASTVTTATIATTTINASPPTSPSKAFYPKLPHHTKQGSKRGGEGGKGGGGEDIITSATSLATACLAGVPHPTMPPPLPPSPRTLDITSYAYELSLQLQRQELPSGGTHYHPRTGLSRNPVSPTPPPRMAVKLRMAVTECTMESAYAVIIPRAVLPLILVQRLSQLEHARASLDVFVTAMVDGGQRGAWKDSQRAREGNSVVRKLNSPHLPLSPGGGGRKGPKSTASSTTGTTPTSHRARRGAAAARASPASASSAAATATPARGGFNLSHLYGRLVSHIEREEEAKAGAAWLVSRTLRLLSYVTDLTCCMKSMCGILPGLPMDTPQRLMASVRITLLRAQFFSQGPTKGPTLTAAAAHGGGGLEEDRWGIPSEEDSTMERPPSFSSSSSSSVNLSGSMGPSSTHPHLHAHAHAHPHMGTLSTFKSSQRKKDRYSRWIATNLHVQLLSLGATTGGGGPDVGKALPAATATHACVTVGAPAAHWSDFKGGSGLGQDVVKMVASLEEAERASGVRRELAVNALWREVEESRLSLRLRCDTVMTQALSAVGASLGTALTSALKQACGGVTARAVAASGLHLMWVRDASPPHLAPAQHQAALATASALASWARHTHASLNSGCAALRTWVVPGATTAAAAGEGRAALGPQQQQQQHASPGFLVTWESLLSCVGKERGMIDDARFAAGVAGGVQWIPVDAQDVGIGEDVGGRGVEPSMCDEVGGAAADGEDAMGALLGRLCPTVLAQYIRAIPTAALEHAEATLREAASKLQGGGGGGGSSGGGGGGGGGGGVGGGWKGRAHSTTGIDAAATTPGLTFLLPIRGLRRAVEVGLIPDRLLPCLSNGGSNNNNNSSSSSSSSTVPSATSAHAPTSGSSNAPVFKHQHLHQPPPINYAALPSLLPRIPTTVAFITVGINEAAAAAEAAELMGSSSLKLQRAVNATAVDTLGEYVRAAGRNARWEEMVLEEWGGRVKGSLARAKAVAAAALTVKPGDRVVLVSDTGAAGENLIDRVELEGMEGGGGWKHTSDGGGGGGASSHTPSSSSSSSSSTASTHSAKVADWMLWTNPFPPTAVAGLAGGTTPTPSSLPGGGVPPHHHHHTPPPTLLQALQALQTALVDRLEEGTVTGEMQWLVASLCHSSTQGVGASRAFAHAIAHPTPLANISPPSVSSMITPLPNTPLPTPVTLSGLGWTHPSRADAAHHLFTHFRGILHRLDGANSSGGSSGGSGEGGAGGAFEEDEEGWGSGGGGGGKHSPKRSSVLASSPSYNSQLSAYGGSSSSSSSTSPTNSSATTSASSSSSSSSNHPSFTPSGESLSVSFLRCFEDTGRVLMSGRITSCKSAKDRTGMSVTLEEARLCAFFEAGVLGVVGAVAERSPATLHLAPPPPAAHTPPSSGHYLGPIQDLTRALALVEECDATLNKQCARLKGAWGGWSAVSHHSGPTATELFLCALGGGAVDTLPQVQRAFSPMLHALGEGGLGGAGGSGSGSGGGGGGGVGVAVTLPDPDEAVAADVVGMANFLREYGPRISNAEKNTGSYYYAFNALQRAFFPSQFQAPRTTIGGKHS